MSLTQRITTLERAAGGAGTCPACGSGKVTLLPMNLDADEPAPPYEPKPCPLCGEVPNVITLAPMRLDGNVELEDEP